MRYCNRKACYKILEVLYCDRKNAFVLSLEPTDAELLRKITEEKSHFGCTCGKLGIEVISAGSPQAKSRIERSYTVYQDRFVKKLKLRGISTITRSNELLGEVYLAEHNHKFPRPGDKIMVRGRLDNSFVLYFGITKDTKKEAAA